MGTETLAPKPLIYSIDDDASMNKLMEARFTKFGCEIRTFSDPKALLNAISQRKPALLVLDLNLEGGLSGFNIIETVRIELKHDYPIIVVSSESDSPTVAHALELGATDFVVKPPFRLQFEEKVAEYIRTSSLPEYTGFAFRPVKQDAQSAKIHFQISIQSVNPLGFTLVSTHLIRKGSSFWLSGDAIKKISPSSDRVFVTVLESATQLTGEQRIYQIRVEVDTAQEQLVREIKEFINSNGDSKLLR